MFVQRSTSRNQPTVGISIIFKNFVVLAYCFIYERKLFISQLATNIVDDDDASEAFRKILLDVKFFSANYFYVDESLIFLQWRVKTKSQPSKRFRISIIVAVNSYHFTFDPMQISFPFTKPKRKCKSEEAACAIRKTVCKERRRKSKNKCKITSCLAFASAKNWVKYIMHLLTASLCHSHSHVTASARLVLALALPQQGE